MKKIYLISFLAFIMILFPILSNTTLFNAQQATGPQYLLNQSSSENKIEILIYVGVYDIDIANMRTEVTILLEVIFPYMRGGDNLNVWLWGDGDSSISCALLERDNTRTSYIGTHNQTTWLIRGNQEFYPFESYYTRFKIRPSLAGWENLEFIFSENSWAAFLGEKKSTLTKIFKATGDGGLQVSFENYGVTTVDPEEQGMEYPMLRVHIEREERFGILILSPVLLAYVFLAFSFMIKVPETPKGKRNLGGNLRNRLTIYLALFTFSMFFFFSIGPISPSELSLAAVLVLNLSICVSISGMFSILSNTISKNLNFFALISCVFATFLVLWSQFLESITMPVLISLLVPILVLLIPALYLLFSWLWRAGFKEVGIAFIIFFLTVPLILTVLIPSLQNSLPLSVNTPWGIITSVWIHGDINHLIGNLYHFVVWGTLFLIANMRSGVEARRYSSKVFLSAIFISAFVANALYLMGGGTSISRGSSGVVYASMGVLLAYALSTWTTTLQEIWHKLRKIKLRKTKRKSNIKLDKRFLIFIVEWLSVLIVISVPLFLIPQIILAPESFFGKVSEDVNVFVHTLGFSLGLLLSLLLFYFYQFSKKKERKRAR